MNLTLEQLNVFKKKLEEKIEKMNSEEMVRVLCSNRLNGISAENAVYPIETLSEMDCLNNGEVLEFSSGDTINRVDKRFEKEYHSSEELKEFQDYLMNMGIQYFDFTSYGTYFNCSMGAEDVLAYVFVGDEVLCMNHIKVLLLEYEENLDMLIDNYYDILMNE